MRRKRRVIRRRTTIPRCGEERRESRRENGRRGSRKRGRGKSGRRRSERSCERGRMRRV